MTGHKDGSHKATKVKRKDVTEQKRKCKALKPAPVASLTAINGFVPMKYTNRKVTVVPGKSLRIAMLLVAAHDVETADASAVPCFATLLTTEHTDLRRYLLEDVLFAEVGMQVLFCVAPTHPNYESYEAMHDALPTKVPRRLIGNVSYQT